MAEEMKLVVNCPNCGWRMLDKMTPTSGYVAIKCQRCRQVVRVNLALRRTRRYRRMQACRT